jgi:hypothetical protein
VQALQNFALSVGDDQLLQIAVTNPDGSPKDLTGGSVSWCFAVGPGNIALVTKAPGTGLTITNASGGLFQVALAAADTHGRSPGKYHHEARLTDASADHQVIMTGTMILQPSSLG